MKRVGLYALVAVLGSLGLLSALRVLELLFLGGLSAYNAGQVAAQVFLAILCLWGATKILVKARTA